MDKWEIIELKTSVECMKCKKMISEGDTVYAKLYEGVKHYPVCPTEPKKKEKDLIDYDERRDKFFLKSTEKKSRFFYPRPDYDDS